MFDSFYQGIIFSKNGNHLQLNPINRVSKNRYQPINLIMIITDTRNSKKRLHVLEADIITIKKNTNLMSLPQRMHFLQDMFQMITIVLMTCPNSSSKGVSHPDTLFFQYGMNLLIDGHLEFKSTLFLYMLSFREKNLWSSDRVNVETTWFCSTCWSAN